MSEAFYIKQNDTSPTIQKTLTDSAGNAVDLTGATVRFHMVDRRGVSKVDAAATIVTASSGIVKYEWQAGDTDTAMVYRTEWEATYADSSIERFPNDEHDPVVVTENLA